MKKFVLAIATGLGFGYLRPASGTWGTLVGIPVVLLLHGLSPFSYLVTMIGLFCIGAWAAGAAEIHFQKSDASQIVIDEIVGYMLTMFLVPLTFWNMFWAFILFRFFDVVKFWPARSIDRADIGGLGVMADDVAAAVYANIALHLLCRWGWFGCVWK